ncbi:hypothetical protein OESDEN_20836 [Oesophagostomum dentatum]|uniref:Uncharacterized protein n=1 Tax=Oesophagostomum dentatum TaxID=61180 RepID=A0A0B1S8F3_OESDE|nr:hypothetical protein OESDEN_20836 [Oesophagostomum dentatum]
MVLCCTSLLCLRHFGYDATKTIDALLARDVSLPLALRRVEAADLTPRSNAQPTLPAFSFQNEELVLSALPRPQKAAAQSSNASAQAAKPSDGKNVFKGLISLAPVIPSHATAATKTEPAEKPVSEVMKKLREALEGLKLRAAGVEDPFEPQFGVNGERLVPMPTAKKYAGIKKIKISEADKVAIRPTYEKYRYETPNDDDVYDDEYDDGYEQREFKVEPLKLAVFILGIIYGARCAVTRLALSRRLKRVAQRILKCRKPFLMMFDKQSQCVAVEEDLAVVEGEHRVTIPSPEQPILQQLVRQVAVTSTSSYTGGRQRQMKERHKNAFKQRGADRKMRGAY